MLTDVKVTSALDYASGSADRNGAALDMTGYEGVLMVVKFATIATGAVTAVKAQQDTVSTFAAAAFIEGAAIDVADDDDNQIFILDVKHPGDEFVRLVIDKDATNATAESAVYIQYGPSYKPTVNDVANAVTTATVVAAAEAE